MAQKQKIDMRYNDVKEAIKKISNTIRNTALTDEAIAVLVSNESKKISKTQVLEVLKQLPRLEKIYLKPQA